MYTIHGYNYATPAALSREWERRSRELLSIQTADYRAARFIGLGPGVSGWESQQSEAQRDSRGRQRGREGGREGRRERRAGNGDNMVILCI